MELAVCSVAVCDCGELASLLMTANAAGMRARNAASFMMDVRIEYLLKGFCKCIGSNCRLLVSQRCSLWGLRQAEMWPQKRSRRGARPVIGCLYHLPQPYPNVGIHPPKPTRPAVNDIRRNLPIKQLKTSWICSHIYLVMFSTMPA